MDITQTEIQHTCTSMSCLQVITLEILKGIFKLGVEPYCDLDLALTSVKILQC